MSRKPYDLPVEEAPGEGLEEAWWEDDLVNEPEPEAEPETPPGFSEEWEEEPLLAGETQDWGPDNEDVEGFDDLDDWDPLIEAEELPESAEVFEKPTPLPADPDTTEDEDEDDLDEEQPGEPDPEQPEPEAPAHDPWEHQVVSWAPSVRVNGQAVAATCATDQARTVVGPSLVEDAASAEVLVRVEIEGREVHVTARVSADAEGCVVLGRDALAQARLLVDPAQN